MLPPYSRLQEFSVRVRRLLFSCSFHKAAGCRYLHGVCPFRCYYQHYIGYKHDGHFHRLNGMVLLYPRLPPFLWFKGDRYKHKTAGVATVR
jgi:hypothetical protein